LAKEKRGAGSLRGRGSTTGTRGGTKRGKSKIWKRKTRGNVGVAINPSGRGNRCSQGQTFAYGVSKDNQGKGGKKLEKRRFRSVCFPEAWRRNDDVRTKKIAINVKTALEGWSGKRGQKLKKNLRKLRTKKGKSERKKRNERNTREKSVWNGWLSKKA